MKGKQWALLLMVPSMAAAQCRVDINNEVHIKGDTLEIVQSETHKLVVDGDDQLAVEGEILPLTPEQRQALSDYKQRLSEYGPKVKQLTDDGLAMALEVVDEVAQALDDPDAFDNLKSSMSEYFAGLEQRYYSEGEYSLPKVEYDDFVAQWQEELDKAKALFTSEFFSDAFTAMSEKMQLEGGINLTQMAEEMGELKDKLEARLKAHREQLREDQKALCEELEGLKEDEEALHLQIPQLENYRVFTI
ncbi:DUF2884 family protein [Vibrio sp. WXL103]|uniref:DUF2884 family protein n=1 Tax=Vibrio sp. WXL103 TaxID=3450710 RepID=UPI003EC56FE8